MQRIKRTLQWLTGIVVGLYLAAMVLLDVPVVQRWAASGVASLLGSLLETNVQVGRIGLAWNGRILIDDLQVEDLQGEEMLRAARLGARISLADLARKRIRIGNAQLFGVQALLYQEKQDSAMNIQFLIDAFASKDTTRHTPLDLRISQVVVRRGQVRLEQRWKTHDLTLSNLNLTAQLNALTDDSLNLKIKRLDTRIDGSPLANEFELKALSLAFVAGKNGAELSDFRMALPHSIIEIPSMTAGWQSGGFSLSHLPHLADITYQATMKAQVTPSDLTPFLPKANKIGSTAYLNLELDG